MSGFALTVDSLCKAFQEISCEFFAADNKGKYEDYIGVEKLCEEFLSLDLPKASDILNVAAGPGILSAMLQRHGYCTIDGLDMNTDNIKALMKTKLYRNYINRPITGLNSSGLKEDVYDAVVMVGGFCPDNICPTALTEIFRITKPEGHVLWTMREDYHMKKSDYGLLDENLAKLEKEGKCIVLKQGEKFTDPHSNLTGLIYVVKRIDKEDFEPEIVPTPEIVVDAIKRAASDDHVYDDSHEDVVMVDQYTGHVKLCQAFFKLRLNRNVEILDVSSNLTSPGLVGLELSHNGYECVDGLDDSLEALNQARMRKVYRNYILGHLDELGSIPVKDESYDVILMSGGFAPGQILPSAFPELIRVLRPGGYIMWTMQDGYGAHDPDFALFDIKVQDLVLERKWELLVGPVFFDNFANDVAGRFYMLRKCHREVFALGSPRHSPSSSPKLSRRRPSLKTY